jgi:coenzyme F420-reducing hydrogenase delta subunit/formate hydrogenlyase subunit 6/NADH:ubiquinone oxidoreductase subunit I
MSAFEPTILAFCCNYCAYAAADIAGVSRMQYPPNLKIIRLPCTGKVDITYLFRAFETGADGVIVCGCLKGGCHFVEGNLHAEDRITLAKEILEAIGIGGVRLDMFFISSAMAPKFVEVAKEVTERIRALGPALPHKVALTPLEPGTNKRMFLYNMIKNLALQCPDKPISVPEGLEEFGEIEFNPTKCIGCRKCEEICPEKAIDSTQELDLSSILAQPLTASDERVTKRFQLYQVISKLAKKRPSHPIPIPEGLEGFYTMHYNPQVCVFCEKCSDICLEKAVNGLKELDLSTIMS